MEYHRISFIHDDTEYSFIKAMNAGLTGYDLMKACRVEVTIYMKENNLKGRYITFNPWGRAKASNSIKAFS